MSTNEVAELIKAYSQDPIGQGIIEGFSVMYEQGNTICGDTIVIYMKISDEGVIQKWTHAGDPQMFTLAAASMLAEVIEGKNIEEVLSRGGDFMEDLGLLVSPRRKRSTVSALLASHNAIYKWKGTSTLEEYEDILEY